MFKAQSAISGDFIKEGGISREFSSNSNPTFYQCTVFRQPRPIPEGALSCRWPADDCIVYYRMGGLSEDNSIVYDFYALVARCCARKNRQLRDLTVLIKSLISRLCKRYVTVLLRLTSTLTFGCVNCGAFVIIMYNLRLIDGQPQSPRIFLRLALKKIHLNLIHISISLIRLTTWQRVLNE